MRINKMKVGDYIKNLKDGKIYKVDNLNYTGCGILVSSLDSTEKLTVFIDDIEPYIPSKDEWYTLFFDSSENKRAICYGPVNSTTFGVIANIGFCCPAGNISTKIDTYFSVRPSTFKEITLASERLKLLYNIVAMNGRFVNNNIYYLIGNTKYANELLSILKNKGGIDINNVNIEDNKIYYISPDDSSIKELLKEHLSLIEKNCILLDTTSINKKIIHNELSKLSKCKKYLYKVRDSLVEEFLQYQLQEYGKCNINELDSNLDKLERELKYYGDKYNSLLNTLNEILEKNDLVFVLTDYYAKQYIIDRLN